MREQDLQDTRERYRRRWEAYGYDPRTLGWNKGCQYVRFQAALEGIEVSECTSLLDVGCGFGDLVFYLRHNGWKGSYTGVDIVPELLSEARDRHSADTQARFLLVESISTSEIDRADIVLSLGIFNHKLSEDGLAYIASTIAAMWNLTAKVMICDFLSSSSDPHKRQDHLFYAQPSDVFGIVRQYTRRIVIHHAYMPFEFNVKAWRDDSFNTDAPVFHPYRHLAPILLK